MEPLLKHGEVGEGHTELSILYLAAPPEVNKFFKIKC